MSSKRIIFIVVKNIKNIKIFKDKGIYAKLKYHMQLIYSITIYCVLQYTWQIIYVICEKIIFKRLWKITV